MCRKPKVSQRAGRNAAHCPDWPLQPQRCFASRCAGRTCGAPLTPETSASPAGLTARARPEARPRSARRTSTDRHLQRVKKSRNSHFVRFWQLTLVLFSLMKTADLVRPDIIGIYIGIIGIILAFIFYVRSKERVKPRILIEGFVLIGETERLFPETVEIRYNGQIIPTLTKVRVTLWNAGPKTLNSSDIASSDPLRIIFPKSEARILDIRSVVSTRDVINAKAVPKDNDIYITFDFLDRYDGITLEVFCDGAIVDNAAVRGTIKGLPQGIMLHKRSYTALATPKTQISFSQFFLNLFGVLSFLLFIIGLFSTLYLPKSGASLEAKITTLALSALLSIICGSISFIRYRNRRIPRDLRRGFIGQKTGGI